jgi:hypothetical protein
MEDRVAVSAETGAVFLHEGHASVVTSSSIEAEKQVWLFSYTHKLVCVPLSTFVWQRAALISVVREQHALVGESAHVLVEAEAQINKLEAEKAGLSTDLVSANLAVTTATNENRSLKHNLFTTEEALEVKTVECSKMVAINNGLSASVVKALRDSKEMRKNAEGLERERDELERVLSEMAGAPGAAGVAGPVAVVPVAPLLLPGASGRVAVGAPPPPPTGTFKRALNVVQFAETACVESHDGTDWDHLELKKRVVELVQHMTPSVTRAELERMAQEVNCLSLHLIS